MCRVLDYLAASCMFELEHSLKQQGKLARFPTVLDAPILI